jgi:hypothetical protein
MTKKSVKAKVAEGKIYVRAIIEIVGKPKEYVEETLKGHLKKLKAEEGIEIVEEKFEKAEQTENYFSAFAEIELLFSDFDNIVSFCFDYMPASVEILDPERITMENNALSDMLNDIQSRMHSLNTGIIQANDNTNFHIRATAVMLRNFVTVLLSAGPMSAKQMSPLIGLNEDEILKVVDILKGEGRIKQEKDKYMLQKPKVD